MNRQKLLPVLRHIVSRPTAPFHEQAVAEAILGFLKELPHVRLRGDKHGNLIAHYERGGSQKGAPRTRFAFAAHMDHPGWVRADQHGLGPVAHLPGEKHPMQFLGGVPEAYLAHPKVRGYGRFAMWDLRILRCRGAHPRPGVRRPDWVRRDRRDLHGVGSIGGEGSCVGLFTRAEEVGFLGALKLAASGLVPDDVTIISLETSAERPPAKIGDGPIIRVGDKSSIFDSAATATLAQIAADSHIPVQRCLMPGGTCEATAYQLHGFRAAALCVALGNYHNCGPRNRIAPEYVSFADVRGLVRLCTHIAVSRAKKNQAVKVLKKRLRTNAEKYRKLLKKRL